ncbi:hypothetical protein [Sandaracinus amylolyticus]|uniref:hypothetical protein n=1 Tax=Sandaracinus amylolyticus TaxID=927083 RepID=UPI001F2A5FC7|nr:hypothetical protein [Sandaracinus amylolyticus]UJR86039.1 Hypothetical protein I5071_81200 [Sandaracinus amylolyticus]
MRRALRSSIAREPRHRALAHITREIDELCPDTYCERGVVYHFDAITCVPRTCTVAFRALQFGDRDEELWSEGRVEVSGWTEVIDVRASHDFGVSESFSIALGDALTRWESEHARRR